MDDGATRAPESTEHPAPEAFKPPADGSWVPRARLNDLSRKLAEKDVELEKLRQQPVRQPDLTRQELEAAVAAGKLSRDEADHRWEEQFTRRVVAETETRLDAQEQKRRVAGEIRRFEEAMPSLKDESSDAYDAVRVEYGRLVDLGLPHGPTTVLAATKAVFGSADRLKVKPEGSRPETFEDRTGGGEDETRAGKPKLTQRQRDYYTKAMNAGQYASWDEVYKELSGYTAPPRR